jgi:methenyltetrahydrofolate cyclohydrolase
MKTIRIPNYATSPMKRFLDELGSVSTSPGGGSAAALTAASGMALLEMTARINLEREFKKTAKKNPKVNQRIAEIKKLRYLVLSIVTKDAKTFTSLVPAFKKDKSSPEYQKALKKSAEAPLEICEWICRATELGMDERLRTSRWLASDLAEAAVLLEAAFISARMNVDINLKSLKDTAHAADVNAKLDKMARTVCENKKEIMEILV